MRTTKFRAWDKIQNRIVSWEELLKEEEKGDLALLLSDRSTLEQFCILMQYTGLTCNGYEWYEGDILENDSDWYEITWDNDQARWEATGLRSTHESIGLSELISQETFVQGNKFENPELLEVTP